MRQSNNELEEDEHEDVLRDGEVELGDDHAGAVGRDEDQGEQHVGYQIPPLLSTCILITLMSILLHLFCHLRIFDPCPKKYARGEEEDNQRQERTNHSGQEEREYHADQTKPSLQRVTEAMDGRSGQVLSETPHLTEQGMSTSLLRICWVRRE